MWTAHLSDRSPTTHSDAGRLVGVQQFCTLPQVDSAHASDAVRQTVARVREWGPDAFAEDGTVCYTPAWVAELVKPDGPTLTTLYRWLSDGRLPSLDARGTSSKHGGSRKRVIPAWAVDQARAAGAFAPGFTAATGKPLVDASRRVSPPQPDPPAAGEQAPPDDTLTEFWASTARAEAEARERERLAHELDRVTAERDQARAEAASLRAALAALPDVVGGMQRMVAALASTDQQTPPRG